MDAPKARVEHAANALVPGTWMAIATSVEKTWDYSLELGDLVSQEAIAPQT
jgi:hypothetical protein